MSKLFENELKTMQRLINYGNTSGETKLNKPIVEYQEKGADGKTYGIVKECNKYYIKVAPAKNTEVLAEDYDYIGGFMNKKENEYDSYTTASKHFDIKLRNISEALGKQKQTTRFQSSEPSEWQINETKEMRKEIERYNELVNNVDKILTEDKGFTMSHTLPEAPAKNPSKEKVNTPFTDTAVAKGDKDLKDTETNYEKAGAPFTEDGKVDNKDMQSDKAPKSKGCGSVYCEKPKFAPKGAVAAISKEGGKTVKCNEGKTIRLTEEQVLAWNNDKDYLDTSSDTEIGDSFPYEEEIVGEECLAHKGDNQDCPKPGTTKGETAFPYEDSVNEAEEEFEIDLGDDYDDVEPEEDFDDEDVEVEDDFSYDDEDDEEIEPTDDDIELEIEPKLKTYNSVYDLYDDDDDYGYGGGYDDFFESTRRRGRRVNETKLDVFGKHPAYRKKPMTTPANKEIDRWGRDWNDDSAKSEEPFGTKIGKGDPYTEEVIDILTDAIVSHLSKKKR